jgi:hypothetical protein
MRERLLSPAKSCPEMALVNHARNTTGTAVRHFWPLWLAIAIFVASVAAGVVQGVSLSEFFAENGPIENAGLAAFVIGAFGFAALAPDRAFGSAWYVPVIFLLMAARELDFDKRFTEKGILQLRLYTGDYPLGQKLIGAGFVLLILAVLYLLVRRGVAVAIAAVRAGKGGWVWVLAVGVGLVVVAKTIDGAGRKLAPYGIEISDALSKSLGKTEEMFEFLFGLALLLAICLWARGRAAPKPE